MRPTVSGTMAAGWVAGVLLMVCLGASGAAERSVSGPGITVRWAAEPPDTNRFFVEVSGIDRSRLSQVREGLATTSTGPDLLAVYAEQGDVVADLWIPPMVGTYRVQADALRFDPQFPLQSGVTYRAVFQPDRLPGGTGAPSAASGPVSSVFKLPVRPPGSGTVIRQIFPSAGMLPENLLKFYVQFSAPMSRGHIYEHIHLRDAAGKEVDLPFLEIDEELWDTTLTRLTLFIDPGRIKRGVKPLEEVGPALQEGRRYTLTIDPAWKDGTGNPLREGFQKTFGVGPPDREPPDPALWKIEVPRRATHEPLAVIFPKPMDHALAQRLICVTGKGDVLVPGITSLVDEERRWTFVPAHPWARGRFQLVIQTTIEDLAGNNIGKPFEVDLVDPVQRHVINASVKLRFEIK